MSKTQRRFFQIHLSTAVVLMLVAGVLLWANFFWQRSVVQENMGKPNRDGTFSYLYEKKYMRGWPWTYCIDGWNSGGSSHIEPEEYAKTHEELMRNESWSPSFHGIFMEWSNWKLSMNIGTALTLLLSVCVACEWLIRRREARKAAE